MQGTKKDVGLWISPSVYRLNINDGLKMLLATIVWYDNDERGCFAKDEHLAELMGKSINTIQDRLRELENLELIERTILNGKRRIKSTIPKNQYRTTEKSVSDIPKNQYHNKESNKEIIKRESVPAFDFLKLNYPNRFNGWLKKYQNAIPQYQKFIADYNCLVEIKEMPRNPEILFNFLCSLANGYINNSHKFNS
ncbi:helix-turn-helix domain-containing protein [Maribacter aurantiacus]|uniref:Helix-turn-helix domain-containing protein n=1 Tax=Maribacter aurantiacus TaxID=1882343 RepID=A0A5R8MBN6_9FLAO|nr:helix-turn-helix domain-containing protein [Maribacter aurantiacus]TLF46927.1 helix-turn-helix domain-containing protein [Maribacter aurantiacus]